MTTENIFSNDILNGDLTTSLVPELGQEDISLNLTPPASNFSDPLTQEISLTELKTITEEFKNSTDNNSALFNNINSLNIDPVIGNQSEEFSSNNISVGNALVTPPISELQLQGGFGDYDGGNDVTLEVESDDGDIVETYALSGKGQATLYRDINDDKAYVFFSGTDETTSVEISAKSNIQFASFTGDSLQIETSGSIDGGNVTLTNPDETGLILKSGSEDLEGQPRPTITGFETVELGLPGATSSYVYDINNKGEAVGYSVIPSLGARGFVYRNGRTIDLNLTEAGKRGYAYGINDSGTIVGSYDSEEGLRAFSYSGSPSNLGTLSEDDDFQDKVSIARKINNNGQIVGWSILEPEEGEYYNRRHAFLVNGGSMTDIDIDNDLDNSEAPAINDSGQVVLQDGNTALIYKGGQITNIGTLPGQTSSNGYGINNLGQVVGISGNRAFLYSDGEMIDLETRATPTDINDYGDIVANGLLLRNNNENYTRIGTGLTRATGINNSGQIVGLTQKRASNTSYSIKSFFLDPIFAEPKLDDYINIGNISTFGDTVALQGNQITLAGNTINTQGGNIEIDGATTINNNLVIDSSVTEDEVITDGGDITFTNILDAASAGGQNLTIKAGTGNLLFSETVGGEATFFDFAIEGAGSLTINNDLAVDGNLNLEVINDINVANLSAAGLVNISLGKVGEEIYDSTGNVTTGNIEALGLEVLNNGNFTAGELTAADGNINVISLNQLNVGQLVATNGAIDLISGTAGITVGGSVQGDNGFVALAQQDIITDEITSSQDAVILKSSQGAVTVNGSVTANDDVSLAAANNVTVGAVTSSDESVALISATGIVNLAGAISSKEDLTVASAQGLIIDQEIKAELGSLALVSTQSSVTVNVAIDSAISINIAAKQNVLTRRLRTYGGGVFIDAEQGTATIRGTVNSRGGDIFISALGRVRTKNLLSRSGDISIISDSSTVRTGYIRTDRGNRSGDVYLEAARNIRVAATVEMNGEQYSIYAGDDGVINIAHQQNKKENNRGEFIVGDTTRSGTLGEISGQFAFLDSERPPSPSPVIPIIKGILDFITTPRPVEPPHVVDINPLTGNPYADDAERELVKQLTLKQEEELRKIYNSKDPKFAPYIPRDLFNRGKVDTRRGCFSAELKGHLGDNPIFSPEINPSIIKAASDYATRVSGSPNDYLVINKLGLPAYYDGLVNERGAANSVMPNIAGLPRVVETKYGYSYLNKFIKPEDQLPADFNRFPGLTHNQTSPTRTQQRIYRDMKDELEREALVAETCLLNYAVIFSNQQAYRSAGELFSFPQTRETSQFIPVYRIKASA